MKQISTTNMSVKNKHKLIGNLLGGFGNDNIRGTHIEFFEKNLIENSEDKLNDVMRAPYYYAWICLYSEHIFWYMRSFCFKNSEFKYDDLMLMYNALITQFCEICRAKNLVDDNELESLFNKAVKVLELRHAIIHKGFPNLLPIVFENKHVRKKPTQKKGDIKLKFSEDSTRESIDWFSNPSNFSEIKNDFEFLINICCSSPEFSVGL